MLRESYLIAFPPEAHEELQAALESSVADFRSWVVWADCRQLVLLQVAANTAMREVEIRVYEFAVAVLEGGLIAALNRREKVPEAYREFVEACAFRYCRSWRR